MLSTAAICTTEVRSVQDGVLNDVREDGRGLLQRRPVSLRPTAAQVLEEGNNFNGSRVVLTVGGGTTVMAAASPSVVEVSTTPSSVSAGAANEEEQGQEAIGHGPLHITIDAAPAVVDFYASAIGGRSGQYGRTYLAHVALAIRQLFGAESVAVEDGQSGVAEALRVGEEEEEEGVGAEGEVEANVEGAVPSLADAAAEAPRPHRVPTGYPSRELYLGHGHAFRIDVDVHVQQASGGNLLACAALAVHAALRTVQLPSVTLHEAASGVSVEIDRSKPFSRAVDWSRLPVLAVLLLSPTRQYVVDPTQREELALPQQLHVAASRDGHVCYTRYCQYPSRSSGLPPSVTANTQREKGKNAVAAGAHGVDATAMQAAQYELHPADFMAAVTDAVHVCEAMIADCDREVEAMLA